MAHLENHKNDLKRDHVYGKYAYVTYDDLEYLNKNRLFKSNDNEDDTNHHLEDEDDIESDSREMILAIRAPYGSTLEIPCET